MANNGGDRPRAEEKAKLPAASLALISRLEQEIEELRRLAPPGYEQTVADLSEALSAIHDEIDAPKLAKRR